MVTFLLEIGTEELPADFVDGAIEQWQSLIPNSLRSQQLNSEAIELYGTPRRLAVLITGLPEKQSDREEEIKGPPATAAFKDGKPTPAAEGFARKQEVEVAKLTVKDTDKGAFVFVQKKTVGRTCQEILQELIPQWIAGLEGRRFMRWADGDLRFPRPVRWLVALLDENVLPLEIVNGSTVLKSDRSSRGHRILHPDPVTIPHASSYREILASAYVEVDLLTRQEKIEAQIKTAAERLGGVADIPKDLLAEVINLVEWPTAVVGKFDREFLNLPPEVITTVMISHQRYFPVRDANNSLLPNFITISNGDPAKSDVIAAGNAKVIRARLADAQFFYKTDCDERLESYLPQLETVTFQEDLGSMRDKVDRLMEIAQQIAEQLELSEKEQSLVESAAMLCKADLVTQMVYEFPELQGVMGEKYALVSGEPEKVARAIFEHYLPRGADDIMPESMTGQVVGLADRLDTLVSIFGLGMLPSGSSDPFALRRAANAVVNIIWYANLPINLAAILTQSSADFVASHPDKQSPLDSLQEFFVQRVRTLLQDDRGIDYDLVNAVLPEGDAEYQERALNDLLDVRDRARFLQDIRKNGDLDKIYQSINRSTRLAVKGDLDTQQLEPGEAVDPALFEKRSEQAFYDALVQLVPQTKTAREQRNYQLLVNALVQIAPTLSNFFDGEDSVLVMADNAEIRKNRLNLLGLLRNNARVLADFGAIVYQ